MRLKVNGKSQELSPSGSTGPNGATSEDITVLTVLKSLDIEDPRGVAVAVNGDVVPRAEWASFNFEGGEAIEVLRAVQGG